MLVDLLMQQSSEITKLNLVIFLTISGTFLLVSNIVLGLKSVIVNDLNLFSI